MTVEVLVAAAFTAGFLGSGHCFGMCGPVVVLLESGQNQHMQALSRRLLYNSGRLFFYALLGAIAGASGLVLTKLAGADVALRLLRIIAALLVIALGMNLLFNLRSLAFLEKAGSVIWRRMSPLAKHVIPMTTPARALGAGFVWGALPCGLVYSAVAIAATSGSPVQGAAVMTAFWLGTLPALLLAGASANRVAGITGRPLFRRVVGCLLIAVGVFALAMPFVMGGGHSHGS